MNYKNSQLTSFQIKDGRIFVNNETVFTGFTETVDPSDDVCGDHLT